MNLIDYINQARREMLKNHIEANSVVLNERLKLVREGIAAFSQGEYTEYPPMILGLSAYLTDELPDDTAFLVFRSSNPTPTREEEIRKESRRELLDEMRTMSLEEISKLIEDNSYIHL